MHSKDGVGIVYARPASFQIQNVGYVIRVSRSQMPHRCPGSSPPPLGLDVDRCVRCRSKGNISGGGGHASAGVPAGMGVWGYSPPENFEI